MDDGEPGPIAGFFFGLIGAFIIFMIVLDWRVTVVATKIHTNEWHVEPVTLDAKTGEVINWEIVKSPRPTGE